MGLLRHLSGKTSILFTRTNFLLLSFVPSVAVSWDIHLGGGRELRSPHIALEVEPAVKILGQVNYWGRAPKRNW